MVALPEYPAITSYCPSLSPVEPLTRSHELADAPARIASRDVDDPDRAGFPGRAHCGDDVVEARHQARVTVPVPCPGGDGKHPRRPRRPGLSWSFAISGCGRLWCAGGAADGAAASAGGIGVRAFAAWGVQDLRNVLSSAVSCGPRFPATPCAGTRALGCGRART